MLIADRVDALVREFDTRNPFLLCKRLDITVETAPLYGLRGIYICEENVEVITIADDLGPLVAEFVCAHELGHSQMHKDFNRFFMDSSTFMVTNRYENEADKFAAHLLYGEPPLFQERTMTDEEMADCLNIPISEVVTRLMELGVYQTLYFSLAKGISYSGINSSDIRQIIEIAKKNMRIP